MPFSEAVEVNPRRPVARGTLAPFVDMATLPAETRGVRPCRVRPVGGGGSRFTNGDTLFARITPCTENGKTGLVDCLSTGEVATGSTEFIVLGSRSNVTLPRFVYYLAKNPAFRSLAISRMRGTSGRQRVPVNVFDDFEVGVPRLPEQRKIAAILSSVDDAIENTQAVIDQVQVVKRGLMQELLTRGLPGRHTRFKQTEIGEIPAEWGTEPLCALVQDGTSITYGIVQPGPHVEHGVPYIKTGDMTADGIRLGDLARTSPSIAVKYRRSEVRSGDLVFAIRATVGTVAAVPSQLDGANLTQGTARISPSKRTSRRFLLWALRGIGVQKWIAQRTKGTTYREITLKTLRDVPIPLPTLREQRTLAQVLDSLAARESSEEWQRRQLLGLKSALMSVLLTGKLRVTPDPETI